MEVASGEKEEGSLTSFGLTGLRGRRRTEKRRKKKDNAEDAEDAEVTENTEERREERSRRGKRVKVEEKGVVVPGRGDSRSFAAQTPLGMTVLCVRS